MPVVVGFLWPPFHDTSSCAIVDGKLVFATEEERHTRHKHAIDEPPIKSLTKTLEFLKGHGINPEDIDSFAIALDPDLVSETDKFHLNGYLFDILSKSTDGELPDRDSRIGAALAKYSFVRTARILLRHVFKRMGAKFDERTKVVAVRHHIAHAASAYYFSGHNSAAVLSVDGIGERTASSIWKVKNGEFENITDMPFDELSIGLLYEAFSKKFKFKFLEGPGKIMGLAPYGKYDDKIYRSFAELFGSSGKIESTTIAERFRNTNQNLMYEKIADGVTRNLDLAAWSPNSEKLSKEALDLAHTLQLVTEQLMLALAEKARTGTGETNLALAGGVALNAKANMEIYYSKLFNDVFVFPASADNGAGIGAAAYVYEHVLGGKMKSGRLTSVSLGPEYGEALVKDVVKKSGLESLYVGSDVGEVASIVNNGGIAAWYSGRSELGPRALGNRSIIASPQKSKNLRRINQMKGREWWRPLAPSVLQRDKERYFVNPADHEFMALMFKMRDGCGKAVPAVCHVDNTSRPQTVGKGNGTWYEMIKACKELSGEGMVINTSFNIHGEPLVETPQDALVSFVNSGLDAIYIDGWLIKK